MYHLLLAPEWTRRVGVWERRALLIRPSWVAGIMGTPDRCICSFTVRYWRGLSLGCRGEVEISGGPSTTAGVGGAAASLIHLTASSIWGAAISTTMI